MNEEIKIRELQKDDAQLIENAFKEQGWEKPASQYERYYKEQSSGERGVFVAEYDGEFAGYVTLVPKIGAGPFLGTDFSEIVDFNVLEKFQKKGIGSALMEAVEQSASRMSDTVTIGVGLHYGYGSAQRIYIKRGYIPDGSGVWYQNQQLEQYSPCVNDDDLILYMSKKLT